MKLPSLFILTGTLFALAAAPPLPAEQNLVIDPTTAGTPPTATNRTELTLQGLEQTVGELTGLLITHVDDDGSSFGLTERVSVGKFVLRRPVGIYQWKLSTETGAERLAMVLNNDHSLSLHSSAPADHTPAGGNPDPDLNSIELRPGAGGGIFFNGAPLISPAGSVLHTSLRVGGGKLAYGDFAVPWWWEAEFQAPGLMAVGNDARAFGDQAVAIGAGARSGYHSYAVGDGNNAQHGSVVLGMGCSAFNYATAIGSTSYAAGNGTVAIGASAYATGEYSIAAGASQALATYSVAIGGRAESVGSWAGGWGRAVGNDSIALGGYTAAEKAFAAASGVTWSKHGVAIGEGTVSWRDRQVVLGQWNFDPEHLDPNIPPTDTVPVDTHPIFVIGNGKRTPANVEERSNAFTVGYDGATWVQGPLTIEGESPEPSAPSVFKRDVSVQGVLRVPASGDLSMGAFTAGSQP